MKKLLLGLTCALAFYASAGTITVRVDGSAYTSWGTDLYGPVSGSKANGVTWGHSQVVMGSNCKANIDYIISNGKYGSSYLRMSGIYSLVRIRSSGKFWIKFKKLNSCSLSY